MILVQFLQLSALPAGVCLPVLCVCAVVFAVLQEEETLSFLLLQVETWQGM